jgi:heme exporter protein D
MEWPIILALVIGIPIILLPVVLIWYVNVSGLYQVMRDARQRQKRRARALKAAEEPVRR